MTPTTDSNPFADPPCVDRHAVIAATAAALRAHEHIRAAWLGGSDASGRTDALSDVDLVVVAEDARVEEVFAAIETALEWVSPISHRYRLPSPTWHGHEQAFYRLARGGPHLLLDLVVMKRSAEDRFLERERHGNPPVLFDRDGLVVPVALDRAAHAARIEERLADLRARFPIFQSFVLKAIDRGFVAEAMSFYRAVTLAPLVELLRIRHCPDRFDFGVRCLDRDLPPELAQTIDRLSCPADLATLRRYHAEAVELFERSLL